jgi:hypothetical protein
VSRLEEDGSGSKEEEDKKEDDDSDKSPSELLLESPGSTPGSPSTELLEGSSQSSSQS